jgi:hypothetical protein
MRADLLASAPDGLDAAIAAVDAFDQALVAGLVRPQPAQAVGLALLAEAVAGTPLASRVAEAAEKAAAGVAGEDHFVALAAARTALLGAAHDALMAPVQEATGRSASAAEGAQASGSEAAQNLLTAARRHRSDRRAGGARRKAAPEMTEPDSAENRREVLYWRLLARLFGHEEEAALESASVAVVKDIGLPVALLDPQASIDSIVQRHPELATELYGLMTPEPDPEGTRDRDAEVRRAALASKVLLNVFDTGSGAVTAGQLARWQSDAGWLEAALGCQPGGLRGGQGAIGPELGAIEADLVKRMHLREVLANPKLAAQLTPSMSLIEQLGARPV